MGVAVVVDCLFTISRDLFPGIAGHLQRWSYFRTFSAKRSSTWSIFVLLKIFLGFCWYYRAWNQKRGSCACMSLKTQKHAPALTTFSDQAPTPNTLISATLTHTCDLSHMIPTLQGVFCLLSGQPLFWKHIFSLTHTHTCTYTHIHLSIVNL